MYTSLEEALADQLALRERIASIDVQLSKRAAEAEGGTDTEYKRYLEWKGKAVAAKNKHVSRLRRNRMWVQKRRQAEAAARNLKRGGKDGVLSSLYSLAKELASSGVEISPEQQQILDDAQQMIEHTR